MKKMTNNSLRSASIDSDSLSVDSRETIPDCAVNLQYKLCFTNKSTNYVNSK